MSLLDKLRTGERAAAPSAVKPHDTAHAGAAAAPAPAAANTRFSNGLKDFLWHLSDVQGGHLLDLGPVYQSTVSFFTDRGFRVYTEDLLRAWKEFFTEEEKRLRAVRVGQQAADSEEFNKAALAERFVKASLQYPPENFHAILLWDLLDYLDADLLSHVVNRLHELLRPGGVALGMFHSRKPEGFHRYRVFDSESVQMLSAAPLFPHLRSLQNRELLNLFNSFRSSKTFVGRDQIREGLFLK